MPVDLEKLNPEQKAGATHLDGPLLVLAGAGTGKTRVITYRVARLLETGVAPEKILAVTFTNKAAAEMRKRIEELAPGKGALVWVYTFHAFGARLLREHHQALGLPRLFTIYDASDQKKLVVDAMKELGLEDQKSKAGLYVSLISRAKDDLLDAGSYEIHAMTSIDQSRQIAAKIYKVYQRKLEQAGALDFGDLLMRVCQLLRDNPEIREKWQDAFSHMLVDEYQDTNHTQYILTKTLAAKHKNVCVVGDDDQCLPAGTPVMTPDGLRAIETIRAGDRVTAATGWGKTSAMAVDRASSRRYHGVLTRVRLRSGAVLESTPNHVCFARLDPKAGMHYVYLMRKKGMGYRVGLTRGYRSRRSGIETLGVAIRANQEAADAVWLLHATTDKVEASCFEQFYSVKYGLPTMVFHGRGRNLSIGQKWIDRLFRETDNETRAERLMDETGLDIRYPHHRPSAVIRGGTSRRLVWFTVFGDPRPHELRPWHEHRVQFITSGKELREKAEVNFNVRDGKRSTWRIETSRKDYDAGLALAKEIEGLDEIETVSRARLTEGKAFHFMPASHLRVGMTMARQENGGIIEDEIISVETRPYRGRVYDLSVPHVRNYIASGVVVHNSIYSWRGANIRNILEFERDFPNTKVVTLERNYRSTARILDAAGLVIHHNKQRKPKKLWTEAPPGDEVRVQELPNEAEEAVWAVRRIHDEVEAGRSLREIAVFYRTNAQSRSFEEAMRRARMPYKIVGAVRFYERKEIKDALAYARAAVNRSDSVSLSRIVNCPPRGLGAKSLELVDAYAMKHGLTLWDAFWAHGQIEGLGPKAHSAIEGMTQAFVKLTEATATMPAGGAMALILEVTGYWAWLESEMETDPEAAGRLANLQELLNAVKEYDERVKSEGRTSELGRYLEDITLQTDLDGYDENTPAVTLMTVHLAKGLEYPVVFLTGLEEGLFPIGGGNATPDDLEEERRLCYVGITRARERLYMTYAATRRLFGQVYANLPSRFIIEAKLFGTQRDSAPATARFAPAAGTPAVRALAAGFKSGQRVKHPQFGRGIVAEVSGAGETMKVTVRFDDGRVAKLLTRYAPLEPA